MGCHFLLQGISPTQGSNLGLLSCRQALYHLSHQGSPYRYIPEWYLHILISFSISIWAKYMWTEMVCSWCLGKVLINNQLVPLPYIYLFQLSFWQKDRRYMKLNSNYQVVPWSWGSISRWKELIILSWGPWEFHEMQGILSGTAWSPREYCRKREGPWLSQTFFISRFLVYCYI